MTINGKNEPSLMKNKPIDVAIAVLMFQDKLLLTRRHGHQHQGDKLEFVGGKINNGETPLMALVREVKEEIGLDIGDNVSTKLGCIYHDYTDKAVCLHVYQVLLTSEQYQEYQDKKVGLDGQAMSFYDKSWVLTQADDFPQANKAIFAWLTLPPILVISRCLSAFQSVDEWVDYYAKKLPQDAVLSIRLQADTKLAWQAINALYIQRDDIIFVLPWNIYQDKPIDFYAKILALRLTHDELMALDVSKQHIDIPIIASCHDAESIKKANLCARTSAVLAVFLSPVLPTLSHPQTAALGWDKFAELAKLSDVPVIALGGLSAQQLPQALTHGAMVVSGIRQFC